MTSFSKFCHHNGTYLHIKKETHIMQLETNAYITKCLQMHLLWTVVDMVLFQAQIYCFSLVIGDLLLLLLPSLSCPPSLLFRHFYFMWFVSDPVYISICVPKALPPSIFYHVFPSFYMTHFLTSCCKLITFFLIENFILVLCSKPLELYFHSFLKHAVIITFSYFLSQRQTLLV